jgi:hypothetical protein
MTIPKDYFKGNTKDIFIAYAFAYIEGAIKALRNASSKVEAVIIQPYDKGHFVSAKDAMHLYRKLRRGEHIPILFTSKTRHEEQFFEYGSRLVDLRDRAEIDVIKRNMRSGRWLMWDERLYARNFLIVQNPIKELRVKPPIQVATNLLSGPSQGEPVNAVSIPSPKVLSVTFRHLLEDI